MNHPAARLKVLIERKEKEDTRGFRCAKSNGVLLQYLINDIWLADIDPGLVLLYQKSKFNFELKCLFDSYITLASETIDSKVFNDYHSANQSQHVADLGVSKSLLSIRSQYKVVQPMHKLKISCVLASFVCLGVGVVSGLRGRLPTAAMMAVVSPDLMRISYNCSDKRYGDLYLKRLVGNVSRTCDTLYLSTKSLLGISPLESHPLLRLRNEVNMDLLVQDTFTQQIIRQVRLHYFA